MQVIGAGFGRTGTSSLQAALEELLGGQCYHMKSVLLQPDHLQAWHDFALGKTDGMNWGQLLAGYTACVDFPVCSYYSELMQEFPKAKVVLTVRDPESWWTSFNMLMSMVGKARLLCFCMPRLRMIAEFTDAIIIRNVFGGRLKKDACIERFERHNDEVRSAVPADRLLVYDVREGWGPLCAFLNVPVPSKPFPHLNAGRSALARLFRRTLVRWMLQR